MKFIVGIMALILPLIAVASNAEIAVPARFVGTWAGFPDACGSDTDDMVLRIGVRDISHWESAGPIRAVVVRGLNEIALISELSDEGQTWLETYRYTLSSDGGRLIDDTTIVGKKIVRYRCPSSDANRPADAATQASSVRPDLVIFEARLTPTETTGDYSSIEFMSAAPSTELPAAANAEDSPHDTPQIQALRLVVYRSEIYQTVVIETLTTGFEGCCARVTSARTFDLGAFAKHFGFKGEETGFEFVEWSSPPSFGFTYNGKPFRARVTIDHRIRINRSADKKS